MNINRKNLILIIVIAIGAGFGGGFGFFKYQESNTLPVIQKLINQDSGKPVNVDFALFWQVWDMLSKKYVDTSKVDQNKMLYGAIEGMVSSVGDPYTVFFEPETSKKFQEEISGSFGGVGIELGRKNDILTVIAPIKDSPADKAGVKTGDRIIKIDTKPTDKMSIEEAVNLIRGKKGEKVTLTIAPEGQDKTRDVQLIRTDIKIPSIKWKMVNNDIAYIQLYTFNKNITDDFANAAKEVLKSNAKGLIIDLRNNPGGLLDAAINIGGWFLDKGQIVTSERSRDGSSNDFAADGNASLKQYPTIVLINGGSASASEILAGALHDNRKIRLVGLKSFGKGSVQELDKFDNGSSLKVTIAKWFTPAGISISEKGINPDIEVKLPENPKDGELDFGTPGKDPQLDKAIELLK